MPHHAMVSAREILARVIRNTGYKLPSVYHDDILEWLPEAIGMLGVTQALEVIATGDVDCPGQIVTKNHAACLPAGLISIIAVEDEDGRRLPEGGDVTDLRSTSKFPSIRSSDERMTTFEVNPLLHQTSDGVPTTQPGTSVPLYGQDLTRVENINTSSHYYKIQGNHIQTSFEEGFVKIHYLALPVCKDGYPLIPNNENYKSALYWYVMMMLIGAGYEHKVFTYKMAKDEWTDYANKGMTEVSYPSLDTMARINRSTVRLIPPHRYHEDFFTGSEQPERLNK